MFKQKQNREPLKSLQQYQKKKKKITQQEKFPLEQFL